MQKLIVDIETGDPDDILSLAFLLGHPKIDVVAITVHPGTRQQFAYVALVMKQIGIDPERIDFGSYNIDHKGKISSWYPRTLGVVEPYAGEICPAGEVIVEHSGKDVDIYTGGPNKNLGLALSQGGDKIFFDRWIAQGGFAGVGVVPDDLIMEKFKGLKTCPTCNFGGSYVETREALDSKQIGRKIAISKNVCHRVRYDEDMHKTIGQFLEKCKRKKTKMYAATKYIYDIMGKAYIDKGKTKLIHDLLAAVCVCNEDVCTWKEVSMYTEKTKKGREWGSVLEDGTGINVSVDYDHEYFVDALCYV